MTWPLDRSLKKLPKECSEWLEYERNNPDRHIASVQGYLDEPGIVNAKLATPLRWIAHAYSIAACDAYFRSDAGDLSRFLNWSIAFGSLYYRLWGTCAAMRPARGASFPSPLWDSNRAAGPCMLSDWPAAEAGAYFLIRDLENDQDHVPDPRDRWYREGTNDSFYGYFFADAFGIESHYQSATPLVTAYRQLLEHWRSDHLEVFQRVMREAAAFHISRSKHGTDKHTYEFEKDIDRVFPPELLAVQAVRQRLGLPAFEAGHPLVDAPWAVIQALPPAAPHPLAVALEARLKRDYPLFR
ncbi:hypothetical protein EBB59_05080 [Lysobacter pythonis]|uniref:Uncharacterized protein n=1 Tax=Solilutibacter pythonis TaxID=2483112 RepID=A0A3M2HZS1_9GAMM|nr:hypothetical protein [Lysobacter pythonis]RMH93615.1 hypothetical protein EBB59_05080 [Lysobacter pythonis]